MRRAAMFAVAAVLAAGSASATGTITCSGADASVRLGIGTLPVLAIVSARIEAEGKVWMLEGAGEGTSVVVGQAARTGDWTAVDFTDPNVTRIVAELRLLRAAEGVDAAEAGILRIAGHGVWPLVCEGP